MKGLKKLLASWIVNAISLWIVYRYVGGMHFSSAETLIMTSLAIMAANTFIKPVLKLFTFPLTFMSFGLFSFVLNGLVLMIAFNMSSGARLDSILSAIIASIALSVVNHVVSVIIK